MKLSPRNEIILAAAIIVVLVAAIVALLIVPQFAALGDLDRQMQDAQSKAKTAQTLLAQRQSQKTNAAATQADLMRLQNEVPDTPELPTLIVDLQNAATEAGVDFVKIMPATPDSRASYSAVPVELTAEGRWADTVEFVHRIQNLERQVRVTSVNIKPLSEGTAGQTASGSSSTTTSDNKLTSVIKLEAYTIGAVGGSGTRPGTAAPPSAGTANP